MREWQVGDPAGDGNDIGVPDIPYMGYLKEDGDDEPQSVPQRDFLDRVLDTTYILEPERTIVKSELERLLKTDGAYLSDVNAEVGSTDFRITRKNRYFTTVDVFYFIHNFLPARVFEDSVTLHFHDGLLEDSRFRQAVKQKEDETGWRFEGCNGGYETTIKGFDEKFELIDEYRVTAHFVRDDGNLAVFVVDFSDMSLSDDYIEFRR